MTKGKIRMTYARRGEDYDAVIYLQVEPTRGFLCDLRFSGVSFPQLMSNLARVARKLDECTGITLVREEAPNPYVMSSAEVAQLITDPAAAISSMMPVDRIVEVRDKPCEVAKNAAGLRVGHDTLADAFGDFVYCRRRKFTVEDPVVGRWIGLHGLTRPLVVDHKFSTIYDRDLSQGRGPRAKLPWVEVGDRWLKTPTLALIELGNVSGRGFYLPRRWNKSGPWISHEELKQKYETYLKEKEDATNRATSRSDDL